ncbi:MAG: hypothetical protein JSR58_01315 [Verrucomicrobia bacterium]|nr:hypothetical protein [Verrucomicrobiota bacterium]
MRILKFLFVFLAVTVAYAEGPVATALKPREPQWRHRALEQYPSGQAAQILFYDLDDNGAEVPLKLVAFYPSGQVKVEADVIQVSEEEAATREWKSRYVPHGVFVALYEDGKMERMAQFTRGLAHGETRLFYPSNQLKGLFHSNMGKKTGHSVFYFADGVKAEEGEFDDDKPVGDHIRYFAKGTRAALIHYAAGVPDGDAFEWYENGSLKVSRHFEKGLLHSQGKHPAVVVYNEDHGIQEVQDFQQGEQIGYHLVYHKNGKESYKVAYKKGKKEGKEQFFSESGALLGEGEYRTGTAIGKHWRHHENGKLAFLALYDDKGLLQNPIEEFNAAGQKTAHYFVKEGKLQGPFKQWYDDGKPKVEFNYDNGEFEGEQKEFYASGQMHKHAFFKDHLKDGVYEEWYENGKPSMRVQLSKGMREGPSEEWYENGKPKLTEQYVADKFDVERKAWFENGQQKFQENYAAGKKVGVHKEWNEKGDLLAEISFENDVPNGVARFWFEKDKPRQEIHFVRGVKEGLEQAFYANGHLKSHAVYKNDKMDGLVKSFYEDGTLALEQMFREGTPIGEHKEYHRLQDGEKEQRVARYLRFNDEGKFEGEVKTLYPDGTTQMLVSYKNGKLQGMRGAWDPQGNLVEEAWYEDDKLHGKFFQKLSDGREMVFHYANNRKQGPHEIYYPPHEVFGKVKALEVNYVKDKPEGIATEYDEAGNKLSTTPYVNGEKDGEAVLFNPKGQIVMKVLFKQGKKEGPAFEYFSNGNIMVETYHVADERQGEEKTYHSNGKLASKANYVQGKLHGLSQNWNDKGVLVFEGEYKEGLRHGKLNKYYDDGKPEVLQSFVDDQLQGVKKSYDEKGVCTETKWEKGKKV